MAIDLSIYNKTLKVRYVKHQQSLYQLDYSLNIRKWMKAYFPNATAVEHKLIRDEAREKEKKLKKQWWDTADKAFRKLFKRPMEATDYRVSGIGRDEFPEAVKNKLRQLITEENTYHTIAYAHNLMLPATMRNFNY